MSTVYMVRVRNWVYLPHEAVEFFLAVIAHANAQLKVSGYPEPLRPLDI